MQLHLLAKGKRGRPAKASSAIQPTEVDDASQQPQQSGGLDSQIFPTSVLTIPDPEPSETEKPNRKKVAVTKKSGRKPAKGKGKAALVAEENLSDVGDCVVVSSTAGVAINVDAEETVVLDPVRREESIVLDGDDLPDISAAVGPSASSSSKSADVFMFAGSSSTSTSGVCKAGTSSQNNLPSASSRCGKGLILSLPQAHCG